MEDNKLKIEEILIFNQKPDLPSEELYRRIKSNWDAVAKPLDSLGKFEEITSRMGAMQGSEELHVFPSVLLVFCADNGIVEEGVSQSGQEVTAICAGNIAGGRSSAGKMAADIGVDVIGIDVGMACETTPEGVRDCHVRRGSRNFRYGRAMTLDETYEAIQVGMDLVAECKEKGYQTIALGEMGIGNTTTASAVAAALLKLPAEEVTGRGAGLSDNGLAKKKAVIDEAILNYYLYEQGAIDILRTVGGYDIAAMAGAVIGGAFYQVPIVLDGPVSLVAALVAERLVPGAKKYCIASHKSRETVVEYLMKELEITDVIEADMALGEGTGALLMISLLKTVLTVYHGSTSFANTGITQYERFEHNES